MGQLRKPFAVFAPLALFGSASNGITHHHRKKGNCVKTGGTFGLLNQDAGLFSVKSVMSVP